MTAINTDELAALYERMCKCRECHLPSDFCPQLRPPGPNYRRGGIVFMQINPGQTGSLTDQQIAERYRRPHDRAVAMRKRAVTTHLRELQTAFLLRPSPTTYQPMRDAFLSAMATTWGWPEGKYGRTVEAHGVKLDAVAMANLAQCPVPGDSYRDAQLARCWSHWTASLLSILQPALVVAQGKQVWDFLSSQPLPRGARLIEGLHHADRRRGDIQAQVLQGVREVVRGGA
jgi:hypothetical protein